MLYFTRWKALAIILTALVVCLFAVPNFFPQERVKTWPVWAQRHIVLGLDLQGGSYLLLEVDSNYVKKEKLDQVRDEVRRVLRDAKIGYTGLSARADAVEVRVKDTDLQAALPKLRELSQPLGGLLGSSRAAQPRSFGCRRRADPSHGAASRHYRTHPANHRTVDPDRRAPHQPARHGRAVDPAAGHRPHPGSGAGLAGSDRVEAHPWHRPPRWNSAWSIRRCRRIRRSRDSVPADSEVLMSEASPKVPYVVKKQVLVSGGDLTDAQPGFDQRTNEPIVNFKFNSSGSRKFAQATSENVGRAVCDHPRQQGDLRARDPRADHRRRRGRFPAASRCRRPTSLRCCCGPARCRRR